MSKTKQSLGTINKCIYCGNRENRLSEEHIVPFGLGGIWTLKRASCKECQNITSGFESDVLRRAYLPTRIKMNLPTRHKNNRPSKLPLTIERGKQRGTINIPMTKRPTVLLLPRFKQPAYIDKREYSKGIDLNGMYIYQFESPTFKQSGREIGVDSVEETVTFKDFKGGFSFARLLAKIAFGFTVAHFGVDAIVNSYVLPSILGQEDSTGKWVGCTDRQLPKSNNLHEVKISVKDSDIYAYIRLFANLKGLGPEYIVVVGHASQIQTSTSGDVYFHC